MAARRYRSTRKRYASRPKRRSKRSTVTRRRRFTSRRRGMSRKSILNLTSEKKRDTMLCFTNTTIANPAGNNNYGAAAAVLKGNVFYIFPFIPTARFFSTTDTSEARRNNSLVYARGYSENVRISTNDGMPWEWRRIVFTNKGGRFIGLENNNTGTSQLWHYVDTTGSNPLGYTRVVNNVYSGQDFQNYLFRGTRGRDWVNEITAPLDRSNVRVLADSRTNIASGNEEGCTRTYKRWYSFNKYLKYNDDEVGGTENGSEFSTDSRMGMGDVYIVDLFSARAGATASSQLSFEPDGTYYWHEK